MTSVGATSAERRALSEFATEYFTQGSVYEDSTLAVFRALGKKGHYRRLSLPASLWVMNAKRTRLTAIGRRIHERGIVNNEPTSDMREAPLVQGGILILAGGRQTMIEYRYPERTGHKLPIDEIRTALRALPRPIVWPPMRSSTVVRSSTVDCQRVLPDSMTSSPSARVGSPAAVERARLSVLRT